MDTGDGLQGAAADCNSAEETHAWFDSRVAHHFSLQNASFARVDRRVFRCNGKRLFLTFFLQNIAVREYSGEVFFLNAFHE